MAFGDKQNRYTQPFIKNSKVVFTLPLGQKILEGKIVLHGNVVLSAVTNAGAVAGEGAPINLIDRVIVHANPAAGSRYAGGEIVNCTQRSLLRYAATQHCGKFIGEQAGSTLGAGANGTYAIYLSIPIYFADATLRAKDASTALNTDAGTYASVQVEVRTADILACLTGFVGTVDYSQLMVDWIDDRVDLPGQDTNTVFMEDHTLLIPATSKRALDPAMPNDGAFMAWLILAQQGAAGTLADTLLSRVKVEGNPIDFEKYAQDIRQKMLDDEWIDPSQSAAGMYFIDWTDGVLHNSLIASTLQTKLDYNNVSGANLDNLLICTRRIFPPAPASGK
jgi:hypothetical protein